MITQRCSNRPPPTGEVCGACVYWLQAGEFKIMVDLTPAEAHELAKPGRTLEEILTYAGLRTWKVPARSNRSSSSNAYRAPDPAPAVR
jgi:hypothetical protein